MAQVYWRRHYKLAQVGEHFGVSYATVGRPGKSGKPLDVNFAINRLAIQDGI